MKGKVCLDSIGLFDDTIRKINEKYILEKDTESNLLVSSLSASISPRHQLYTSNVFIGQTVYFSKNRNMDYKRIKFKE
jgi:hypothetical protein